MMPHWFFCFHRELCKSAEVHGILYMFYLTFSLIKFYRRTKKSVNKSCLSLFGKYVLFGNMYFSGKKWYKSLCVCVCVCVLLFLYFQKLDVVFTIPYTFPRFTKTTCAGVWFFSEFLKCHQPCEHSKNWTKEADGKTTGEKLSRLDSEWKQIFRAIA